MSAYFEEKTFCCPPWPAWKRLVDDIFCICLQERPDRRKESHEQFHKFGLCSLVTYYRPIKDPKGPKNGSWEAHRAVSRHARNQGYDKVLIFEDDVCFSPTLTNIMVEIIAQKLASLPKSWDIFLLGHFPLAPPIPVSWDFSVWRVWSVMIHAYIIRVNAKWVDWIISNEFKGKYLLDAYTLSRAECYAFAPMVAFQTASPSNHPPSTGLKNIICHYCVQNCVTSAPIAENISILLFFIIFVFVFRFCYSNRTAILRFSSGK